MRSLIACPKTVKLAVAFWLVGCIVNSVRTVVAFGWRDLALFGVIWLGIAWFVLLGMNWARWILLALVSIGVLSVPRALKQIPEISIFDALICILLMVFHIGAAGLLLADSARPWFRKDAGANESAERTAAG
jgi:hypothetical protein